MRDDWCGLLGLLFPLLLFVVLLVDAEIGF